MFHVKNFIKIEKRRSVFAVLKKNAGIVSLWGWKPPTSRLLNSAGSWKDAYEMDNISKIRLRYLENFKIIIFELWFNVGLGKNWLTAAEPWIYCNISSPTQFYYSVSNKLLERSFLADKLKISFFPPLKCSFFHGVQFVSKPEDLTIKIWPTPIKNCQTLAIIEKLEILYKHFTFALTFI